MLALAPPAASSQTPTRRSVRSSGFDGNAHLNLAVSQLSSGLGGLELAGLAFLCKKMRTYRRVRPAGGTRERVAANRSGASSGGGGSASKTNAAAALDRAVDIAARTSAGMVPAASGGGQVGAGGAWGLARDAPVAEATWIKARCAAGRNIRSRGSESRDLAQSPAAAPAERRQPQSCAAALVLPTAIPFPLDSTTGACYMPLLGRRALLLAAACVAVATMGGSLFPALGVFGTWRLASTGWKIWKLARSGEFPAVSSKDVLRHVHRCRPRGSLLQVTQLPSALPSVVLFGRDQLNCYCS